MDDRNLDRQITQKLTIGQMAESNGVTKKTLLLYHEKGLLIPDIVDAKNGRRYYSAAQSYRLDFIQRLQAIGLSLDTISDFISTSDNELLSAAIREQIKTLEKERVVVASKQSMAEELAVGIEMRGEFIDGQSARPAIQLRHHDPQCVLVFSSDDLGIGPVQLKAHPCESVWRNLLNKVKLVAKRTIEDEGLDIPISIAFRNVGVVTTRAQAANKQGLYNRFFIGIDASIASLISKSEIIPGGEFLTIDGECLCNLEACHGLCVTTWSTERLFDYSIRHNYETDDLCYTYCLADPIALREGKLETLFQTRLRVLSE